MNFKKISKSIYTFENINLYLVLLIDIHVPIRGGLFPMEFVSIVFGVVSLEDEIEK